MPQTTTKLFSQNPLFLPTESDKTKTNSRYIT